MLKIYLQKDFSSEYEEFILCSDRCKNILTLAKVQPFYERYGLDIGVYSLNSQRIPPHRVKENKIVCISTKKISV